MTDMGQPSFGFTRFRRAVAAKQPRQGLGVVLLAIVLLVLAFTGPAQLSADSLERSASRALESFAISRAINAVISALQEVEPGFSLGVSMSAKPGQLLDPINDLVERFSSLMLFVSAILWTFRLLLVIATTPWVVATIAALACARWWASGSGIRLLRQTAEASARTVALAVALVAYLLAFPLVSEAIHHTDVVSGHFESAVADFRGAQSLLEEIKLNDSTVKEQLGNFVVEAKRLASELTRQVVVQISVFVLETVLVPLLGAIVAFRLEPSKRNG